MIDEGDQYEIAEPLWKQRRGWPRWVWLFVALDVLAILAVGMYVWSPGG